jgi:hypothetical protein
MLPEISAQSRFFQHDPTLITSLSQMIQSENKVSMVSELAWNAIIIVSTHTIN